MTSKGKWIIVIKKQEGWSTNRIHKEYGFDKKTIRLWESRELPSGEVESPEKVVVSPVRTRGLKTKIQNIRKKELQKGRGYNFNARRVARDLPQENFVEKHATHLGEDGMAVHAGLVLPWCAFIENNQGLARLDGYQVPR